MIETLTVRAEVPGYRVGDLVDFGKMVWPDVPWSRGRGGSAYIKPGAPGATTVAMQPISVGSRKGGADLVVQGNLTRLVYGEQGKSLTLPPSKVVDGVGRLVDAVTFWLGPRTPAPWDWRVSRVDANGTVELPDRDSELFMIEVARQLWGMGKGDTAQHGRQSLTYKPNQTEEVAVYSKSAESNIRGPRGGILIRTEVRDFSERARRHYGGTLVDVIERGGLVSKERVSSWLERLGRQVYADTSRQMVDRLIAIGFEPQDAFRLAAPALIAAADGVAGLTSRGVPERTAYRWISEIRARVEDPDRFVALDGMTGIQLTVDDVVFAHDHFEEVS
jgi:hypothetical protein